MKAISNNQTFFIYRSWSETTSHKNSPEFNSNNNKENIRMKIIIIISIWIKRYISGYNGRIVYLKSFYFY